MNPNIGIAPKNLEAVGKQLSGVLANEVTLYLKTRKFHWNISGNNFMEFHKLLEDQYKKLEILIDETAERIGKLGRKAIGTMSEYENLTEVQEHPDMYPSSEKMLMELMADHEMLATNIRSNISDCNTKYDDAGTADFLTGILQEHETMAWVLRRYFE